LLSGRTYYLLKETFFASFRSMRAILCNGAELVELMKFELRRYLSAIKPP